MSNRDNSNPVNHPSRSEQARTAAPSAGSNMNAHPESAPQGDGPPMSLMLAPAIQYRSHNSSGRVADPARELLAHLSATAEPLPPFTIVDSHLLNEHTPAEVVAIMRAAGCPDLFVVHVADHTSGERVIAGISRLLLSGRTLVLSPNPATADRIVERLIQTAPDDNPVQVIRTLAEEENPVRPSQIVSKRTSVALLSHYESQSRHEATTAVATADDRVSALERLCELTEQAARLDAEIAELRASCDGLESIVAAEAATEASPLANTIAERCKIRENATVVIDAEVVALTRSREIAAEQLATLRQQHASVIAESAKKPGLFGRLFGASKTTTEPTEIESRVLTAEAELQAIDARLGELQAARTSVQIDETETIIRAEIAARTARMEDRMTAIHATRDQIRAAIETLSANDLNASNLAEARRVATHQLVTARECAAEVDRCMCNAARQSLASASIIVGTPGSLHNDPVFDRDQSGNFVPFDVLILDRAEEVTESDFLRLAALASRWILVGEVPPVNEARPHWNANGSAQHQYRNGRVHEPCFAARVARELNREPWVLNADWLVCRLAHASVDQRSAMTREPLVDRPEVELRFITDDAGEPVLAEVAFPAGTTVAAAKAFLFAELGDVRLQPCGTGSWCDNELAVCWPQAEASSAAVWIDLDPGVREKVVGDGLAAFTAAVTFDTAMWDKETAAAWLAQRLPTHSSSRYAAVPHAARPGL